MSTAVAAPRYIWYDWKALDVLCRVQKEVMQQYAVAGRYSGLQMSSIEDKSDLLVVKRRWFHHDSFCDGLPAE